MTFTAIVREWEEIQRILSQCLRLHHFEIINHSLLLQSNFIDMFKEHCEFVYCICKFCTQPEKRHFGKHYLFIIVCIKIQSVDYD